MPKNHKNGKSENNTNKSEKEFNKSKNEKNNRKNKNKFKKKKYKKSKDKRTKKASLSNLSPKIYYDDNTEQKENLDLIKDEKLNELSQEIRLLNKHQVVASIINGLYFNKGASSLRQIK